MIHTYTFPVPDSALVAQVTFSDDSLHYRYSEKGRATRYKSLNSALLFSEPEMKPAQRLQVGGLLYAEIGKWAADPEGYAVTQGVRAVEGLLA